MSRCGSLEIWGVEGMEKGGWTAEREGCGGSRIYRTGNRLTWPVNVSPQRHREGFLEIETKFHLLMCAHTISVKAPMKCGDAVTPSRSVSSSTALPIEYQRADLRRWTGGDGLV